MAGYLLREWTGTLSYSCNRLGVGANAVAGGAGWRMGGADQGLIFLWRNPEDSGRRVRHDPEAGRCLRSSSLKICKSRCDHFGRLHHADRVGSFDGAVAVNDLLVASQEEVAAAPDG
jgi:hypothetical protein